MFIYLFNGKNSPQKITAIDTLPSSGFIWINCQPEELLSTLGLIRELTNINLDEEHIRDCLNPNHPSFCDSMQDYDLLIFQNLNTPPMNGKVKTHPVCFIVFEKILLTVSDHDASIETVNKRLLESGRRQPTQPIALMFIILTAIVDNFLALRAALSEQLERWQKKLLDEKKYFTQWQSLLDFKSNLRRLYVICEEQQDALDKWRQNMEGELSQPIAIRLNDLSNHILRMLHHIDELENELDSLMELHYAIIGKRTNEIMRILTVISGIFLPLTLITNIFGMNFETMIGLKNEAGFFITLAVMLVIAVCLLAIFRWKKWI